MIDSIGLASVLPAQPTLSENINFILVGFGLVLLVLLLLSGMITLIGILFRSFYQEPVKVEKPSTVASAAVTPQKIAVIAAVVNVLFREEPHRIVSVKPIKKS